MQLSYDSWAHESAHYLAVLVDNDGDGVATDLAYAPGFSDWVWGTYDDDNLTYTSDYTFDSTYEYVIVIYDDYADGGLTVTAGTTGLTYATFGHSGSSYVEQSTSFFATEPAAVSGCTDSTACNFDSTATADDGSCDVPDATLCEGCVEGASAVANDLDGDGVCDADEVAGCPVSDDCNYDANRTDDDDTLCTGVPGDCQSCQPVLVSGDWYDYVWIYYYDCGYFDVYPEDCGYWNTGEFASCVGCGGGVPGDTSAPAGGDSDGDLVCDADEVEGCQDASACNYDETATDAGSCNSAGTCDTCNDDGTVNSGGALDGICESCDQVCEDSVADWNDGIDDCASYGANNYCANYGDLAGPDGLTANEVCCACGGGNSGTASITDNDADDDGVCDADEVSGCTDSNACNHNVAATDDDGSCLVASGCDFCDGEVIGDGDTNNNDVCDTNEVDGCDGILGSGTVLDDCGICDGGNASQDCAGTCSGVLAQGQFALTISYEDGSTQLESYELSAGGENWDVENCGNFSAEGGTDSGTAISFSANCDFSSDFWAGYVTITLSVGDTSTGLGSVSIVGSGLNTTVDGAVDLELSSGNTILGDTNEASIGGLVVGGCDNTCGSTLELDACGVCDGPGAGTDGCCDNAVAEVSSCSDTDNGATDSLGYSCAGNAGTCYNGSFDDSDFDELAMCCACGGGETTVTTPGVDATGPNGEAQDCNGDCGGSASLDECGDCAGGNSGNDACTQDECGIFGGSGVDSNSCCDNAAPAQDAVYECTEDPNWTDGWDGCSYYDTYPSMCGYADSEDACCVCGGGTETLVSDAVPATPATGPNGEEQDCAGVCGGDAALSNCGVCEGIDNTPSEGTCDCEGTVNGTVFDDCYGFCGGEGFSLGQSCEEILNEDGSVPTDALGWTCEMNAPYSWACSDGDDDDDYQAANCCACGGGNVVEQCAYPALDPITDLVAVGEDSADLGPAISLSWTDLNSATETGVTYNIYVWDESLPADDVCTDCVNDYTAYGAACCDAAWETFSLNCAQLEAGYSWDCTGCSCPGDITSSNDYPVKPSISLDTKSSLDNNLDYPEYYNPNYKGSEDALVSIVNLSTVDGFILDTNTEEMFDKNGAPVLDKNNLNSSTRGNWRMIGNGGFPASYASGVSITGYDYGETAKFHVTSINNTGQESDASNEAEATTPVLEAPTGLTAVPNYDAETISLSWDYPGYESNPYPSCTGDLDDIGDGWCNSDTNVPECGYDGGDCCASTCDPADHDYNACDACLDCGPQADSQWSNCYDPDNGGSGVPTCNEDYQFAVLATDCYNFTSALQITWNSGCDLIVYMDGEETNIGDISPPVTNFGFSENEEHTYSAYVCEEGATTDADGWTCAQNADIGYCGSGYDDDDYTAADCCHCGGSLTLVAEATQSTTSEDCDAGVENCTGDLSNYDNGVCDTDLANDDCNNDVNDCANGLPTECTYDFSNYGAADCDAAAGSFGLSCAALEANYGWDCNGCSCPLDQAPAGCEYDWSAFGAPGDGGCDDTYESFGSPYTCSYLEANFGWDCSGCACDGVLASGNSDFISEFPSFELNQEVSVIASSDMYKEYEDFGNSQDSPRVTESFRIYSLDDDLNGTLLATTTLGTTFQVNNVSSGCFAVAAYDSSPVYESALSDAACVEAEACPVDGDSNGDGSVNVADVVSLVNSILNSNGSTDGLECGDVDGDGSITVSDIVSVVNIILGAKTSADTGVIDATEAKIVAANNSITIESNGMVQGLQMKLSHGDDFSIDLVDAYIAEYVTKGNLTSLVIATDGSSSLVDIASFEGENVKIESSYAVNSTATEIALENIVQVADFNLKLTGPNPFNPSTSLSVVVPEAGLVSVNVYNILGQQVATLANGYMEASSTGHTLTWNAENLASGVYLVRANASGKVSTQKLMLLK